jgi:hypothetical protein
VQEFISVTHVPCDSMIDERNTAIYAKLIGNFWECTGLGDRSSILRFLKTRTSENKTATKESFWTLVGGILRIYSMNNELVICANYDEDNVVFSGYSQRFGTTDVTLRIAQRNQSVLAIEHNAGFFSCCHIRLSEIIKYVSENRCLPDSVDSSNQFSNYKTSPDQDLSRLYFEDNETDIIIPKGEILSSLTADLQRVDYRSLDFANLQPFIRRYFSISGLIRGIIEMMESRYFIDYQETCAVFYRGNDKSTETVIASHEEFIIKARQIRSENHKIKFLVQTDETEFMEAFLKEFWYCSFFLEELPHMKKCNNVMHNVVPANQRTHFGANFLAATQIVSKCHHLITHSGNCGLFAVLYRAHGENVHQYLDGAWLDRGDAPDCRVIAPGIIVRKALYGVQPDGPFADVTEKVIKRLDESGISIYATNMEFGDPAIGAAKSLYVEYVMDGIEVSRTVPEGRTLCITLH